MEKISKSDLWTHTAHPRRGLSGYNDYFSRVPAATMVMKDAAKRVYPTHELNHGGIIIALLAINV